MTAAEIYTGCGSRILVSPEDFSILSLFSWRLRKHKHGAYAHTNTPGKGGSPILMHRVIMGLTKGDGLVVDHINRDGLDNRRENLRVT